VYQIGEFIIGKTELELQHPDFSNGTSRIIPGARIKAVTERRKVEK
jgi:hypothetical protein